MTKLEKIVLLLTHWTVGNAIEPDVHEYRWARFTAGREATEDTLMELFGYIINGVDETRMDWTAFKGFMETVSKDIEGEEGEETANDEPV